MSLPLFAAEENPDTGPSGLVIIAGLVVGGLVLGWLHSIGFYGKAFKALSKSLGGLIVVVVGAVAIATATDQGKDLEAFVEKNSTALLGAAGIFCLAGLFAFYEGSPSSAPSKPPTPVAPARPVAVATAGGAAAALCPSCRGSGQTEGDCVGCCGMGEYRCTYRNVQKHWWGEEYVDTWCEAGSLKHHHHGVCGHCSVCNGRGFLKCGSCRGRGVSRSTCTQCAGKGTV